MKKFLILNNLIEGSRILDLGGHPAIWQSIITPLDITIVNLPGQLEKLTNSHHNFTYIEADATHLPQFKDNDFELVFSNSVIEHVGSENHQQKFASEIRRIGKSYWVQTPSVFFPIEAHCGMPFWWFYPIFLKKWFLKHWEKKLPAWTNMVKGTKVITRKQLKAMFPEGKIMTEIFLVLPKSNIIYYKN